MILAIFLLMCGLQSFLIPVWLMLVISAYGYLDYFILKAEFQTKIWSSSAKIAEYWINNMCEWQPFLKSVRPTEVSHK